MSIDELKFVAPVLKQVKIFGEDDPKLPPTMNYGFQVATINIGTNLTKENLLTLGTAVNKKISEDVWDTILFPIEIKKISGVYIVPDIPIVLILPIDAECITYI